MIASSRCKRLFLLYLNVRIVFAFTACVPLTLVFKTGLLFVVVVSNRIAPDLLSTDILGHTKDTTVPL